MSMRRRVGAVFPQAEVGGDAGAVEAFIVAVEELGYDFILAYDHVVAGRPGRTLPGWPPRHYTREDPFHEPFALLAYAAALTRRIELFTGVLVLPQRQAVLVAKQAAAVAVLSEGRLRLGVGTGWSELEYEALGVPFAGRGERFERQLDLLEELWSNDLVERKDGIHSLPEVGLNPRPPGGAVPLWFGGMSPVAIDRAVRRGAGWIPHVQRDPGEQLADARVFAERTGERWKAVVASCRANGRPPSSLSVMGRMNIGAGDEAAWEAELSNWQGSPVTHLGVMTIRHGLGPIDQHIERLETFRPLADHMREVEVDLDERWTSSSG